MTLRVNCSKRTTAQQDSLKLNCYITAEKEVNIYGIDRAEDQTKL